MLFNREKFREIRKFKKFSMAELAKKAHFSRSSLSDWELGKIIPNESKIRMLAHVLEIPVSDISDLEDVVISNDDISPFFETWLNFADLNEKEWFNFFELELENVKKRYFEIRQISTILKTLLSAFPVMFYIKDQNQKYMAANNIFLDNTSISKKIKIQGKTDFYFFNRTEAKKNHTQDMLVLNSGKPEFNIEDFIPGSKKKKWGLISKIPIKDKRGQVAGIIGTFVDITERKQAESIKVLLEKNITEMSDCVAIVNVDKRKTVYINSAFLQTFGDYTGKNFFDAKKNVHHPDERDREYNYWSTGNIPPIREYRAVNIKGEHRWFESRVSPVIASDVYGNCRIVHARDITEKKKNEELKELLDVCVNSMPDGLIIIDTETKEYIFINKAVENICGYSIEKIKQSGVSFFINTILHPDDKEENIYSYNDKTFKPCVTFKIIRADGEVRFIERRGSLKYLNKRKCFVFVARDVSDNRKSD